MDKSECKNGFKANLHPHLSNFPYSPFHLESDVDSSGRCDYISYRAQGQTNWIR